MFVPLPNLDDRRWDDLVDEGRTLIPVYASGWTDHNVSDPGITIMEMLAWIADGDIYRANRVPDAHVLAFLALLGVTPDPPKPAVTPVQFTLKSGSPKLLLPATTELGANLPDGNSGKYRLRNETSVLPVMISAVQVQSGGRFRDATNDWSHGAPVWIFGSNPQTGDALYLAFEGSFETGDVLNLYFTFQGENASGAAGQRILDEQQSRLQACAPGEACGAQRSSPLTGASMDLPAHQSVTIVWEAQTQPGAWQTIHFKDHTRSMTLSGAVSLRIDVPPIALRTGAAIQPLRYLRCRFVSGEFDAAPAALRILENAAEAEQSSPLWEQWPIAAGVVAIGTPPAPGNPAWMRFEFDANGRIASLEFTPAADDAVRIVVLDFKPATVSQPGSLTVEAIRVGIGTGAPHQLYQLAGPELCVCSFRLYTIESGGPKAWSRAENFVASAADDLHFVMSAGSAEVLFGDGQNGRVPPPGIPIVAIARITNGAAGNAAASAIASLDQGPHNAALLDVAAVAARLQLIRNPNAAIGGDGEESIAHAEGRAVEMVQRPSRAVTLEDCETLALQTPGTSLARAAALADYCPGLPCYSAPGLITVVIVPWLPLGRPIPSSGLIRAVSAYLNRRKVIGTHIAVTGPDYLEVAVKASVKAAAGQNQTAVRDAILAALRNFLDPLAGGPAGTGWPLGRGVYISEVLETIAGVAGVDHVLSLELQAAGCGAQCGDICLDPLALTISGSHQIQVK